MTTPTTISAQIPAVRAALALLAQSPDRPAPTVRLDRIAITDQATATWGVRLAIHRNLSEFEQWRQALLIDPATITADDSGTGTGRLTGTGSFAGVPVELIGFYDVPESDKTDDR